MSDPSRPKVGRKPVFTREEVIAAAVAEGIDRFTLAAVAERLGVATSALYRIFPSRDALTVACLEEVAASLPLPESNQTWQDALRRWAAGSWQACEDYPGLSRVVYEFPAALASITGVYAAYAEHLARHGKTKGQALFALDFIGDTVFACHRGAEAMRAMGDQGKRGVDVIRDAVGDDALFIPDESWTTRQPLDVRVEFIVAGLERDWPES